MKELFLCSLYLVGLLVGIFALMAKLWIISIVFFMIAGIAMIKGKEYILDKTAKRK